MIRCIQLIALAAVLGASAAAQATAALGSSNPAGCLFGMFISETSDALTYSIDQGGSLLDPAADLGFFIAREGQPFRGRSALTSKVTFYRYQDVEWALPYSRAEIRAARRRVDLPAARDEGEVLFDVWLADDNAGCIATSKFRAITNPMLQIDTHEDLGTNSAVSLHLDTRVSEEFSLTVGANNGVRVDLSRQSQGALTTVIFEIGTPLPGVVPSPFGFFRFASMVLRMMWTPQPQPQVLPHRWIFAEGNPHDSGIVQGVANAASFYGSVQHQASVDAGGLFSSSKIFSEILQAAHRTQLWWSATPWTPAQGGTPPYTGPGGGTTPRPPGTTPPLPPGGTTPPGGGTTPGSRPESSPLRPPLEGGVLYGGPYDGLGEDPAVRNSHGAWIGPGSWGSVEWPDARVSPGSARDHAPRPMP